MATKRTVVWFRNDLRIFDNPTLMAASALAVKERTELSCVYCFDPRHFMSTKYVAHKTGIYRSKFLIESVANLRENLRSIGGELLVAIAKPEEFLPKIASAGEVFAQAEVTSEETAVEKKVEKSCGNLNRVLGGNTLHHPEDLPYASNFHDLPAVFTNYRQHVEKVGVKVRPLLPAPKRGSLPKSPAFASIAPSVADISFGLSTASGTAAHSSVVQCGYDYLPTLSELGFSEQEIQAHTQAAASTDVLQSLRTLHALQHTAPDDRTAATNKAAKPSADARPSTHTSSTAAATASATTSPIAPPLPHLAHPAGVMSFTGGETSALQRLQSWMFDHDHLREYFDIRNGMLGEGYSTKLSPWLALGCISPRHMYHESKRYERERGIANKSTYWLTFELLVRDFYRFYCVQHGAAVFYPYGPMSVIKAAKVSAGAGTRKGAKQGANQGSGGTGKAVSVSAVTAGKPALLSTASLRAQYKWSSEDTVAIARWKAGQTGQPLVDANMRELLLTGWMSNRGRQNVASYLIHDLQVDWRIGAAHFEELLLDHDVCSNYGNWNAAASLSGEGKRVNKFNCVKQSKDYDPVGSYLRHWLPELRAVPAPMIFSPTTHYLKQQPQRGASCGSSGVLGIYGVSLGVDYPLEACLLDESSVEGSNRCDSYALHCTTADTTVDAANTAKDNDTRPGSSVPAGSHSGSDSTANRGQRSRGRSRKPISEAGGKVQHD